ncbi:MAG TPA: MurT ligase domain-containing protein [Acidimicrobiales bacterium]|nr:MurT ligase domain-containing protein [Acidimicrobiales bacterium]
MSSPRSLRDAVAARAVRTVNLASRLVSKGSGTVIGGRVGLAISPDLLVSLAKGREIVLVSGTNGKTTTSAMIASGWGGVVATNATGSNMPAGHVAALSASASARAVLEVDEAWLSSVAESVSPRVIVLLNLSRDQLDRANEVRQMAERWRVLCRDLTDVTVVANANDPLVVYAAESTHDVVWCDVPTPWNTDAVSCPKCTMPLHFEADSWWSDCGFSKPITAAVTLREELIIDGDSHVLDLSLPGAFNEANAAMALAALSRLGVELTPALQRIDGLTSVAGRFSNRMWQGHRLRLLLAKNPAGFAAMLETIPEGDADVWVAINARIADGKDPSWLYDVPFELLLGHRVFCFGDRRLDLATRLDYAGVDYVVVTNEELLPTSQHVIDVLSNYTAFQDWREKTSPC